MHQVSNLDFHDLHDETKIAAFDAAQIDGPDIDAANRLVNAINGTDAAQQILRAYALVIIKGLRKHYPAS